MIVLQGLGNRHIMPKELNKINFNACMHVMAWATVSRVMSEVDRMQGSRWARGCGHMYIVGGEMHKMGG
jgi:hypothetical protein